MARSGAIITGELGTLHCGQEQVGGIYEWEACTEFADKRSKVFIAARGIWAFTDLQADNLTLKLYKRVGERLAPMGDYPKIQIVKMPKEVPDGVLVLKPIELIYEPSGLVQ